jgi:hypothetical protein
MSKATGPSQFSIISDCLGHEEEMVTLQLPF